MKKLITIILLSLFVAVAVSGQEMKIALDVNGLKIGAQYTDVQFRAALGEPKRVNVWDDEFGGGRYYYYETSHFKYQKNDGFCEFDTTNNKYKLFGGRLCVGDNITKVSQSGIGTPVQFKKNAYYLGSFRESALYIYTDDSGMIKQFCYYEAV